MEGLRSLKKTLVTALALIVVIVTISGSTIFFYEAEKAKNNIYDSQKKILSVTVEQINFYIETLNDQLDSLVNIVQSQSEDFDNTKELIAQNYNKEQFESVFLMDSKGSVLEVISSVPKGKLAFIPSNFCINQDREIVELRLNPTGSREQIFFCQNRVIKTSYGATYYLVAVVNMKRADAIVSLTKVLAKDRRGQRYLVDTYGTPIAWDKRDSVLKRRTGVMNLMKNAQGEISLDGKIFLATFEKIPDTGWGIIFETPKNNVYDNILKLTGVFIISVLLIALLFMLLAVIWVKRLLKPVWAVGESLAEAATGNLNVTVDTAGPKEISGLAESFNLMVNKIKERHDSDKQQLANYYLYEKFIAIGDVAAGAAHEIRNPLTSIKGFTHLLQSKFAEGEQGWNYAEIIKKDIFHIEQIIEQLLLMAVPAFPLFRKADLHSVIDEVLPVIARETVGSNIKIVTQLCDGIPNITIDQRQIKQLFINLCTNAIQAMPDGGNLTIETSYDSGEKTVTVVIKDEGIGIPCSCLNRIVDPFFSTKENGTGLGLTVCYGIVQNHKGFLQVISTEGVGTTCIIKLPFKPF